MLTQNQALEVLTELLGYKGKLRIVTSTPNPNRDPEANTLMPSYFIQHNVIKIEIASATADPNRKELKAHTEEGDWTKGSPNALLYHLTKWETKEPVKKD